MKWYFKAIRQYLSIGGRARRREFWVFYLINFIVYLALSVVELEYDMPYNLSLPFALIMLIPSITVAIRRLHDINKSCKWLFIGIIPIIGLLVIINFATIEGTEGENNYGADPKNIIKP